MNDLPAFGPQGTRISRTAAEPRGRSSGWLFAPLREKEDEEWANDWEPASAYCPVGRGAGSHFPPETMRNNELRLGSAGVLEEASDVEVVFTRSGSIAEVIENLLSAATTSIDAALYGFGSQRLARALEEAQARKLRLRLVIDGNKYRENPGCQRLLAEQGLSFRLAYGRDGAGSKMHHKFALLDRKVVLTGSYNWTSSSEEKNYENLLILRNPDLVEAYRAEFAALWEKSAKIPNDES